MRLSSVLLRKKGQLRTPKNYQNPQGIQGVLTHTKGVELIPKVPKFRSGPNIHKGVVRRVIQMKSPWDVKRELELEQVERENISTINNSPTYLNEKEETIYLSLLEASNARKLAVIQESKSPLQRKLEIFEGKTIEKTIWKMRRKDAPRQEDLDRKYQKEEIRVDTYNTDFGLQEDKSSYKKGDPDYPSV